ncbi:MAG: LysM peptidoglycan-binding domain-containing protein [Deinococcota bacterium]|jgi:hypothetical protein|nr:LysM peptidoglycan-binding domain-containing protein [Deinococcota bacterium]
MKKVLGILVLTLVGLAVAQEEIGDFIYFQRADPMTDEDRSFVVTFSVDGANRFSRPSLRWACHLNGMRIIFDTEEFLNTKPPIPVRYRFDREEASPTHSWGLIVNNTATWIDLHNVPPFTARALAASRLTIQATSYSDRIYTSVFGLNGLSEALERLPCVPSLVGEHLTGDWDNIASDLEGAQLFASKLNTAYEGLLEEGEATQVELEEARLRLEEAQSEVARLTGARGIYTVQSGDTLTTIASFFYRRAGRWSDILEANSFLIRNPNFIYPGMVLIIP